MPSLLGNAQLKACMGPYLSDSSLRLNTVSLPRLVRTFRQQYPGVTLQLREAMTDTQIEELKRGALDVGLLYGDRRRSRVLLSGDLGGTACRSNSSEARTRSKGGTNF